MKTPSQWLKGLLPVFLSIFLIFSLTNDGYSQEISKREALSQARANKGDAGFDKISFSKSNLLAILNGANAIKILSGLPNGRNSKAVLMIIGLDADGNEIGDRFQQSNSSGVNVGLSSTVMDIQTNNISNSLGQGISGITTSFSAQSITDMLNKPGVDGIQFSPTKKKDDSGNETLTLVASPTGRNADVGQMPSLMSPCPPECFFQ